MAGIGFENSLLGIDSDMRFGKSSQQEAKLKRKLHSQLLFLCLSLVVILAAARVVSKPSFWNWMFPETVATQQSPETEVADISIAMNNEASGAQSNNEVKGNTAGIDAVNVKDETTKSGSSNTSRPPVDQTSVMPSMVDGSALLETIRDDSLGVRASEADAFYAFLAYARKQSAETIRDGQIAPHPDGKPVPRVLLLAEPERYRGKWVTVEGEVKRLLELPNPDPRRSFDHLYEIWLATPDASGDLTRVVCSQIPQGMPMGEIKDNREIWIRLNALFFKREAYEAHAGLQIAPLLLAHQPVWINAQQHQNTPTTTRPAWLGWLGIAFIVVLYVVIRSRKIMQLVVSPKKSQSENDDDNPFPHLKPPQLDSSQSFDWLDDAMAGGEATSSDESNSTFTASADPKDGP